MKTFTKLFKKIIIFLVVTSLLLFNYLAADKPDYPGIWAIWSTSVDANSIPWLKGTIVTTSWKNIEGNENEFTWDVFDRIKIPIDNENYVMYIVYHGDECPDWIYNYVPEVETDAGITYPYYLDPDYIFYFKRLIHKVSEHIETYDSTYRNKIIGLQAAVGKSGDPQPYKGVPLDSQYRIGVQGTEWTAYTTDIINEFLNAYMPKDPVINIIIKPASTDLHYQYLQDFPSLWRKTFTVAQGFQLNSEMSFDYLRTNITTFNNYDPKWATRSRGEFTAAIVYEAGWFMAAPEWNMYWQCLWMLQYHNDILNLKESTIMATNTYPEWYKAFTFFTKHAGYKDPRDAKSAFCALRDGLDYSDTSRFPEVSYGSAVTYDNVDRYNNIINTFSSYGAKQDDPDFFSAGLNQVVYMTGMNDVNYNIWRGNYEMYIKQINPLTTSHGFWRQGSKKQMYGRFARGIQAGGKLLFDIDDGFFFDQPLNGNYSITIRIVFFSKENQSWQLYYDAVGNANKIAFTHINEYKVFDKLWQEKTITVNDGYFGNRGLSGADIWIEGLDVSDYNYIRFHMIEISRDTGDRLGYWGDGEAHTSPTPTPTPDTAAPNKPGGLKIVE